MKITVGV